MLLTGCSAGEQNGTEAAKEEQEENVLTVVLPQELRSLDSTILSDSRTANTILPLIFDMPVYASDDGSFEPGLFLTWERENDGRKWTVTLRQNVRFHNGEEFDARSVDTTFRYLREKAPQSFSAYFRELQEVETVNKYTVVFHFSAEVSSLPELVQHIYMIAPDDFERMGAERYFAAPAGCGPFAFAYWDKETGLCLDRNDAWWGKEEGLSNVDRMVFRTIEDDAYRISQLTEHEADIVQEITAEQMLMLKQKEEIVVYTEESDAVCWSGFVCQEGKVFHDKNARLAVWYAINRRLICDSVLAGGEEWLWPVTPGFAGYSEADARSMTSYDTYLSRVYLSRCDYNGTPVKIIVESEKLPQCEEVAQFFAVMLEAVGFSVDLEILGPEQWEEAWAGDDYDMFISGLTLSENTMPWQYQYMLEKENIFYQTDSIEMITSTYRTCLENMGPFCAWFRMEGRAAWLEGISGFTVNADQTLSLCRVRKTS